MTRQRPRSVKLLSWPYGGVLLVIIAVCLLAAPAAPGRSILVVFIGGFGLGLLIASAFSSFFWWWAIGAVLFVVKLIVAIVVGVSQAE